MRKILYISSEAYPLIKTGGLADVAGSLPRALLKNKQDVRLLLPGYQQVLDQLGKSKVISSHYHYGQEIRLLENRLPGSRVKVWLAEAPRAFGRYGNPYLNDEGVPWDDNAFRFNLFAHTAVDIALNHSGLNWQPDIVHCNDWQTGLVPALLSHYPSRPATVFTIHNMAYQGLFPKQTFFDLGLPPELWHHEALEFHDQLSFIKGGLVFSDRVNTVSPTYAQEIQHTNFGYGLDGLLRHRADRLSGILNGIDTDIWNPGTDPYIKHKFNRRELANKANNKTDLQKKLKLPARKNTPMIAMISRLVEQKGLDTILASLEQVLQWPIQIVILGSGEKHYEKALLQWAEKHPAKMAVIIGYDEELSHQIEASADIFLMPSRFEPCGLNQLYSLRYGTLPLVSNVGGLADSVCDTTDETIKNGTANGFVMHDNTVAALTSTLEKAMVCYKDQTLWKKLQVNAMKKDFSWLHSAKEYLQLYEKALADQHKE